MFMVECDSVQCGRWDALIALPGVGSSGSRRIFLPPHQVVPASVCLAGSGLSTVIHKALESQQR